MTNDKQTLIDIGTQKQLLVDDFIIREKDRAFQVLNQPVKHEGNPILELEPPQGVGGRELVVTTGNVIYDEEERLFKMWYEGTPYKWEHNIVGYAVSTDGIHWELPNLGLIEYQGSRDNNIVFHRREGSIAPGVLKDPVATDPQSQYKMIYQRGDGVGIAFSPDGIHWTAVPDKRVAQLSDSPNSVLWDARLGKYVAHTRHWEKLHFADGYDTGGPRGHGNRVVLQSESDDFLKWTTYGVIMRPDEQDPPWDRQFYNMEWMPYEDVYFGFIAVYHVLPGMEPKITPDLPWMDRTDIQLAFSRDGRTWGRAGGRRVFIPNGATPEEFDWGMVQQVMQHPLVVDDEIWIYYVGFNGRHWYIHRGELQGGAVGLAKLRLDGFVSLDAGEGFFLTKALRMSGDRLVVNADASLGSLVVEILDLHDRPIKGFSKEDAEPITSDSIRHTVKWNGKADVHSLRDRPIALRFYLDRCKVYSFVFQSLPQFEGD